MFERVLEGRTVRSGAAFCAVVAMSLALGGCEIVRTDGEGDFKLPPAPTYTLGIVPQEGDFVDDSGGIPYEEIRAALVSELTRAGATLLEDGDQARFLVNLDLDIEIKQKDNDPLFAFYVSERYEEATLRLEVVDRSSDDTWNGSIRHRLRYVSKAMSSLAPTFQDVDEERDWPVDGLLRRIVERIPREKPAGS